ncbi:endoplasmic reticulum-Golgi intermediate compartment protein 1-like isoform X3 [Artemia franciscana]|uniref:Endoplasmic reticulum-Golgi intermediate compartment protein 1 n=1 Tax=Artemia franciscana TaxID=6661 RepID=A0AA88L4F8_ARTSF|nr:hypothetical protein QYM36_011168 [Artemia franciscana]KAK2712507.1 hypothetical protein QYM36_011260 [Artemia franciscana]
MKFDVKRLDIYRKVPKDLTQPTVTGAIISVCCVTFMCLMFLSEFLRFMSVDVVSELFVDSPGSIEERITVFINISLPKLKCEFVGLDIQDDSGRHEVGFIENTNKRPINKGEGCNFESTFYVNKVPEWASHDYIMKVVPSVYENYHGRVSLAYQYTYAHKSYASIVGNRFMTPAIWFKYDLTPITIKYHEKSLPFYAFLTTVCAIVGGTFTVAGIIDSFIFTASEIFRKFELGKLN